MVERIKTPGRGVKIALVGKYVKLHDAYLSVAEALRHGGLAHGLKAEIGWEDSETLNRENARERLSGYGGVIVPGGFGSRGIEGMIAAAEYCRTNGVPYFGICLGMQTAVIEFARHVLGWADADSGELNSMSAHKVIDLMADQYGDIPKGGTMRLGAYPCVLAKGSRAARIYGCDSVTERHRHRYEFNNAFGRELEKAGLSVCGRSPDGKLAEAVEISGLPFYIGVQFHPEFKSRPNRPHPLFAAFVRECANRQGGEEDEDK